MIRWSSSSSSSSSRSRSRSRSSSTRTQERTGTRTRARAHRQPPHLAHRQRHPSLRTRPAPRRTARAPGSVCLRVVSDVFRPHRRVSEWMVTRRSEATRGSRGVVQSHSARREVYHSSCFDGFQLIFTDFHEMSRRCHSKIDENMRKALEP